MNQLAKYLGQRSFSSKADWPQTHTGPIAVPGPLKCSINMNFVWTSVLQLEAGAEDRRTE